MFVDDFYGSRSTGSLNELESLLNRRSPEDSNAFWLSVESGGFPTLGVLVKRDWAVLHYQRVEGEPGLRSLGDREAGKSITFALSPYPADDIKEASDALLSLQTALQAAKEFFVSVNLPRSVKWIEL